MGRVVGVEGGSGQPSGRAGPLEVQLLPGGWGWGRVV